jgi:hypothetical protein
MLKLGMVLLAAAMLCAGGAQATTLLFTTELSGPAENPPNPSTGTGSALVSYDTLAHTLTVDLVFSGLSGFTTVAHIHCCVDAPGNVGVATFPGTFPGFPIDAQAGTYNGTWDLTQTSSYTSGFLTGFGGGTAAGAEAALLAGFDAGRAYVNIHTTTSPAGEIRGFLKPIPEPTALALFGVGALIVSRQLGRRTRLAR